jgi:hypothetical protein
MSKISRATKRPFRRLHLGVRLFHATTLEFDITLKQPSKPSEDGIPMIHSERSWSKQALVTGKLHFGHSKL